MTTGVEGASWPESSTDEDQTRRSGGIVEARIAEANGGDAVFTGIGIREARIAKAFGRVAIMQWS